VCRVFDGVPHIVEEENLSTMAMLKRGDGGCCVNGKHGLKASTPASTSTVWSCLSCLSLLLIVAFAVYWNGNHQTVSKKDHEYESPNYSSQGLRSPATVEMKGESSNTNSNSDIKAAEITKTITPKLVGVVATATTTTWNFTDLALQKSLARPFPAKFNSQLR
jgi:hypothetical protein